jgi:hypothetical protein
MSESLFVKIMAANQYREISPDQLKIVAAYREIIGCESWRQ